MVMIMGPAASPTYATPSAVPRRAPNQFSPVALPEKNLRAIPRYFSGYEAELVATADVGLRAVADEVRKLKVLSGVQAAERYRYDVVERRGVPMRNHLGLGHRAVADTAAPSVSLAYLVQSYARVSCRTSTSGVRLASTLARTVVRSAIDTRHEGRAALLACTADEHLATFAACCGTFQLMSHCRPPPYRGGSFVVP